MTAAAGATPALLGNGERILVTGASGFVGSQLCVELARRGDSVRRALRSPIAGTNDFVVASVDESTDWQHALDGVTTVLHLAARAHVRRDVEYFRAVNTRGTLRLAEQAALCGVRRFIFVSTIGVHGDQTGDRPFRADDRPAPANAYAVSKLEAELGLWEIASRTGLEVVVVRPPLVYGGRAPGNFGALLRWMDRCRPVPVSSSDNRRSFVAVENLVDLLCRCVQSDASVGQTFLVSDGEPVSMRHFAQLIGQFLGQPARLVDIPDWLLGTMEQISFARRTVRSLRGSLVVDDDFTRERLRWTPVLSLEQALRRAVEVFRADQRIIGS